MNKKIEEFMKSLNPNSRILIDMISGIIFLTFPNIKEKVISSNKGLRFIHSNSGHLIDLCPSNDSVNMIFSKGNLIDDKYNLFSNESNKMKYIIIKNEKYIIENNNQIIEYLLESVLIKDKS